jgi:glyoxylase-like metal-dependent hydrolase (beta-lactamase superfamily II)
MFKLHAVQAAFGDCLILEYGDAAQPRFVLIDGGPAHTYQSHLKPVVQRLLSQRGQLELAVLSHVDNDHVIGLLDLFGDLQAQAQAGRSRLAVRALWHNAFSQTIGRELDETILREVPDLSAWAPDLADPLDVVARGIAEGDHLQRGATALGVPINPGFPGGVVVTEAGTAHSAQDLSIHVLGPSQKALERLRKQWQAWLERPRDRDLGPGKDQSVPNLSSIMLLAETGGARTLLPGDGRADEIVDGLKASGAWQTGDTFHVDLLKLPHHGSARNATPGFFRAIQADRYLICADGTNGNPDPLTLDWLLAAARDDGREFELIATSQTQSLTDFLARFPPRDNHYRLRVLPARSHALAIALSG